VAVAFGCVVTGRALRIEARRAFVEGLFGGELPEAKFKGKNSVPIAGPEGPGESFPRDGYDRVVGPAKSLVHVRFEEAEPVLAANGGP
jgi:hypothetical protein